jgi:hypothetical protein
MPLKNIDYSKTIMYKIVCNDLNIKDVYVGHTTDFIRRKQTHRKHCIQENSYKYNTKLYSFIRENGGFNNFQMLMIESFDCKDANEARTRERYWYETLNANLNSCLPIQTERERENRNEKYVCECGAEIRKDGKKRHDKTFTHISKTSSLFCSD